ncbi:YfbM family protein [Catenuloplanes japonicus]|uniref:YfbM family protein n=1 Tax=Catenuloplanes japonicus TaxID=33876 RepID=UPI0006900AB9|nr:YfbM family protein [Catenuloplanes japonicus]
MRLVGFRVPAAGTRALRDDPARVAAMIRGGDPAGLDLDKLWHLLHYLITGTAWEVSRGAGQAILGGEEIGGDDGHGHPRLLTPDVVAEVADALDTLALATLRARHRLQSLTAADIYPNVWDDPCWADFDEIVVPFLTALRRFYRSAATAGDAVVLALT